MVTVRWIWGVLNGSWGVLVHVPTLWSLLYFNHRDFGSRQRSADAAADRSGLGRVTFGGTHGRGRWDPRGSLGRP